jgi:tyrosine-protein kinase Etk/Wzc
MNKQEHPSESELAMAQLPALDYLRVVVRHWKPVAGLFVLGCLIAGTYSLLSPKVFEATASVLPPQESGGGKVLLSSPVGRSQAGPAVAGLLPGVATSKDIFLGILKSRTMQDDIIRKFELVKRFDLEGSKTPMQSSRRKVARMTTVKVGKEGVISVTVRAGDPRLAADIANFYVENLDRLNTAINTTDAGRSRLFLEGQVAEARKALQGAEERLKDYQSRSKAVVLEGQTKAAIEGAATLEGQILAAEVQLKTLETYATFRNPDVIRLKESIGEMRNQLRRMEYGKGAAVTRRPAGERERGANRVLVDGREVPIQDGATGDFSVALGSLPSTGLELVRLTRDAKIQETIFSLLTEQLEQAKIAEARDTPMVKLLDRALPPEWKSYPKVLQNTVIGGLLAIFVGLMLAFLLEDMERRGVTMQTVRAALRGGPGARLMP